MQKTMLKGQVGLMLLVIIALVVGLILSIASRSLSDTSLSRQGKENNTAFSVAENGIEEALNAIASGNLPGNTELSDSSGLITGNYEATTTSFDLFVREGEQAELDLTTVGAPTITVRWVLSDSTAENPLPQCGEGSGGAPAAIEIVLFDNSNVVSRSYLNSYNCDLSAANHFALANAGASGFLSETVVNVVGKKIMRLKPIYNGATLEVEGVGLDAQLYLVQSVATGGDVQKEIEVKRSLDSAGSVFDYALFSDGVITK